MLSSDIHDDYYGLATACPDFISDCCHEAVRKRFLATDEWEQGYLVGFHRAIAERVFDEESRTGRMRKRAIIEMVSDELDEWIAEYCATGRDE